MFIMDLGPAVKSREIFNDNPAVIVKEMSTFQEIEHGLWGEYKGDLKHWWRTDPAGLRRALWPCRDVMETLGNTFTRAKYCRQSIASDDRMEWVIITWLPGQSTSIHGHPSGGCVFFVLKGSLQETLYDTNDTDGNIRVWTEEDAPAYIDDHMGKHVVRNISESPAISIHLYSPPFSKGVVNTY